MPSNIEQYTEEIRSGLTETSGTFGTISWEKPIPFDDPQLPDFPTEKLPGPLAAFVERLAESTQTPEEMGGLLSLGVLSTAFQSRYDVEITANWREPLCLYCVAVAPPGERKSAVISALTRPVYEYERQRQEREAPKIAQREAERRMLEGELAAAENAAVKGRSEERETKRDEALDLAARLAEFQPLWEFRLLVDDTTPEKLTDLMEKQGGSLTVCSAEGGIFDAIKGRYDRTLNLDIYLKAHAGDPVVVDRVGRRNNRIDNPRLTMLLTVQPEVLSGLMDNPTFRGRGLCGRFLYALCRSKVGFRKASPQPVPEQVRSEYKEFIHSILAGEGRGTIHLSAAAVKSLREYQDLVEKRLGDEWEAMKDWGGKLVGAAVRIAALIHCATSIGDPLAVPLRSEVMHAAISIGEYLGANAAVAYRTMGGDGGISDAEYLWGKIKHFGQAEINKRDLYRACHGHFHRIADMEPALGILTELRYIQEQSVDTGGRPTHVLQVNPLGLSDRSAKRGVWV